MDEISLLERFDPVKTGCNPDVNQTQASCRADGQTGVHSVNLFTPAPARLSRVNDVARTGRDQAAPRAGGWLPANRGPKQLIESCRPGCPDQACFGRLLFFLGLGMAVLHQFQDEQPETAQHAEQPEPL